MHGQDGPPIRLHHPRFSSFSPPFVSLLSFSLPNLSRATGVAVKSQAAIPPREGVKLCGRSVRQVRPGAEGGAGRSRAAGHGRPRQVGGQKQKHPSTQAQPGAACRRRRQPSGPSKPRAGLAKSLPVHTLPTLQPIKSRRFPIDLRRLLRILENCNLIAWAAVGARRENLTRGARKQTPPVQARSECSAAQQGGQAARP